MRLFILKGEDGLFPHEELVILGKVEQLVEKLSSESPKERESAVRKLHERSPHEVLPLIARLLEQNPDSTIQGACLDVAESYGAVMSLSDIRTDGWIQKIGADIGSFEAVSHIVGIRYLAYAIILGVQIRSLTKDPSTPANTMVEFTTGDNLRQVLSLGEFRTRVVQALIKFPMSPRPLFNLPLIKEDVEQIVGQITLLLAPLYNFSVRRLVVFPGEQTVDAVIGYVSDAGFTFVSLDEFQLTVQQKLQRELAGTQEQPFKLDLSAIEPARKAAERGDHDRVISQLETWPGLLATLLKTPIAAELSEQQLATIAEGLLLLGNGFQARGRTTWAEELYRLGLQYVRGSQLASPLYLQLGLLLCECDRYGEAIGVLRRALAMNESKEIIYPQLGRAFLKRKKYIPAFLLFREARSIGVKSNALNKDYGEAVDALKKATIPWPNLG